MFLCQPLLEVLAGRGIEDIDAFLKVPSWNDLPDPFSIPLMETATARVLGAIRNRERIAIFGDYDCDGFCLGARAEGGLERYEGLSQSTTALTRRRPCDWRNGW